MRPHRMLMKIALTGNGLRPFQRFLHGGCQKGGEDRNDRDHGFTLVEAL